MTTRVNVIFPCERKDWRTRACVYMRLEVTCVCDQRFLQIAVSAPAGGYLFAKFVNVAPHEAMTPQYRLYVHLKYYANFLKPQTRKAHR